VVQLGHDLGRDVVVEPNVVFGPGVTVADHVTIHAFSHLEGAKVASKADIGPYARLRPGADIREKAKVGNFVEIKNAVMGVGAKANHLTYVGDAEVGAGRTLARARSPAITTAISSTRRSSANAPSSDRTAP
jgi:bifunctional UDP-N-acetylglucosamine pyrophosphorylase/glucosamine-1-phosphate N-acetyltransferase